MSSCYTLEHLHHGLLTSAIMWQHLNFHQRHPIYTRKNSKAMPNTTYGMIPTFGDSVVIKCILETEINSILQFCHSAPGGGHHGSTQTTRKVLDCGLYWPTIFRDAYQFVSTCGKCQKVGMVINRRHEMPQQPILFCEVFDVWGINFMGPFLVSNGYSYILLPVDYVSRWVEAIATKTNDAKVVVDFLKFGVPKMLISDQGSHFYNRAMAQKYGVTHRIAIAYHPQTKSQAKVFNREIKKMLQKMTNPSRKDWTVKQCNLVYDQAGEQRKFQLQELDELRLEAYKILRKILRKDLRVGQKVLLFNSRLKLIAGKLCSRWDGPFIITNIFPYGAVQLKDEQSNNTFQVNGHQIKPFYEGPTNCSCPNRVLSDSSAISARLGVTSTRQGLSRVYLGQDRLYLSQATQPSSPSRCSPIRNGPRALSMSAIQLRGHLSSSTAATFIKRDIICRYGLPAHIITNNGTNLNNKMMTELYEQFKIKHHNSTPYHPKMNGVVEAANKNKENSTKNGGDI
ncbi:Pro-Pol polyprotein, partial [Mucuna pruriens]